MRSRDNERSELSLGIAWLVPVLFGVALVASAVDFPARWRYVAAALPVVRLWSDPDAQYRRQVFEGSYDLLRQADAIIPRDATVLLVTSGQDVARKEYTAYHRALYFLAPRPVWWLSPAPHDGTWKARWWTSAPISGESIAALAQQTGASYVLTYQVDEQLLPGTRVADLDGGYLLRLAAATPPVERRLESRYAGPLWPLQVAAAVAVVLLFGSMVLAVASRLGYRARGIEAAGLSWALGAGVSTLLMFMLGLIGIHLEGQVAILSSVAALWGLFLLWRWAVERRKRKTEIRIQNSEFRIQNSNLYSSFLLLLFVAAQAAVTAFGRPLEAWDSWVNWGVKARIIFLDGYVSPAVYADLSRTVTHLDYPLLLPLLDAWLYRWIGAPDDRFAGLVSVIFYLSLFAVCYGALRQLGAGNAVSLLAASVVATMSHLAGIAGLVFAELPLVVFATIAGAYLLLWLRGGPAGALFLAALGAGCMLWTKREGALLLAALCLAAVLTDPRSRRTWIAVGSLVVGALVIAGPWWALVAVNGVTNAAFLPITLSTLQANLDRLPTISDLVGASLAGAGWSFIWPLAAAGGILYFGFWIQNPKSKIQNPKSIALLPLAAALFVLMAGFTYLFSAFVPFEQHILGSVDRLVAQVTPLLVVWLALLGAPRLSEK